MFRPTSPQSSLFEVENSLPGALPDNDWSFTYKERVLPLIVEDKFRHLYHETKGKPNIPIKAAVSILIFMGMEKLTWRASEFLFSRRLDWLIATNTPIGGARIDHTTLFKFYQRLEADDTAIKLFVEITDAFIKTCGTSVKMQRTDSFFIHGWLRILSRYGLFKETNRKFLQTLRKQKPNLYKKIKGQLSQDYLEKKFDLTEKDRDLAQRKISLMARDMYRIKSAFENHKKIQHYETFIILCKVFEQQCEVKESIEQDFEIVLKEKPDKDTICTPHNPEVRYVRKGNQRVTGDKGTVTETCDPDNKTQFITDVSDNEATKHDSKEQPEVQERLIENKFKPDKQFGDAGFVNGQTIMDSKENKISLEGPTAGRSQSFETHESKERPFDAGDFDTTYTEQEKELTVNKCPNNQVPKDQHKSEKTGGFIVHFDSDTCDHCPEKNRCPVKIGKRVATYTVDAIEFIGAVRHHQYMSDANYRKECAVRAGAEATVSELTRGHGMRKSRHRKRSRTKLQLTFAALACNVKRFIRHGEKYGYLEPSHA